MGASVALAARARGDDVARLRPRSRARSRPPSRAAPSTAAGTLDEAVAGAELVVVAAPIAQLPAAGRGGARGAPASATVTDVGSTKASVVAAAAGSRALRRRPSDLRLARRAAPRTRAPTLFEGATWFLTPVADDRSRAATALVHGFVTDARRDARSRSTPTAHDRLVALTSHVPHVLANVVANQAGAARSRGTSRSRTPAARCAT